MTSLVRSHFTWITILLLTASVLTVSCVPDATDYIISPQMGEQMAVDAAADVVVAEPTQVPALLADLTEEEIVAGLDPAIAELITNADPAGGETLALTGGCIGCHSFDPAAAMTGPTWLNMGDTAVNREPGVSPAAYLYESIVAPNDYAVPNFPTNIMPQTFGETLSEEDIATLVAYLLAQNGQ